MSDDALLRLPLADLAARLAAGALAPAALVERFLARIVRFDGDCRAYITVAAAAARAAAEGLGAPNGRPLYGLPYAAKDLFATRGLRTTGGSRVLADWVPERDAAAVERAAAAGAVLLGKANLHEFAHGALGVNPVYGTPPNPFRRDRLAGGSSSGSAVAVAAGLAAFALGTDTGGSVRVPAALCGIVGFKPTFGLISRRGVIPYCWTLDHVGPLARHVRDAALVTRALVGEDPEDADSVAAEGLDGAAEGLRLEGLTIGLPRAHYHAQAVPEVAAAVDAAAAAAERLGCRIRRVAWPDFPFARAVSLTLQMPEVLAFHRRHLESRRALYSEELRAGLAFGQFVLAEHYVRARRMMERYRRDMARLFEELDLLLLPTTPITAPPIGDVSGTVAGVREPLGDLLTRFTGLFNMTGNPALSMPCGRDGLGLPIGLQVVGRPYEDGTVLAFADRLERALGLLYAPGFFEA